MASPTGIAAAAKFFGKKAGQTLSGFKEEWNGLTEDDRRQIISGLDDGTLTYA